MFTDLKNEFLAIAFVFYEDKSKSLFNNGQSETGPMMSADI